MPLLALGMVLLVDATGMIRGGSRACLSRAWQFWADACCRGGLCKRERLERSLTRPRGPHLNAGSGQRPLERSEISRVAVRGQHELDGEIEQLTQALDDIVARQVRATAQLNVQPVAEVSGRVAGDDRVDRRQPVDQIVVLAPRVGVDPERP